MKGGIAGFSFNSKKKIARFEVTLPGTNGRKRVRKTEKAESREEALKKWKRFRDSVLAGEREIPLTLKEFCDQYWARISAGKSAKTVKDQDSVLRCQLLPAFGSTRLDKFTAAAIRDFTTAKKAEGYAVSSIDDYVRTLIMILHQAVEREEIPFFPIKGRRPRQVRDLPRLELSAQEKAAFVGAFDDQEGFCRLLADERKKHALRPDSRAALYYFQRFRASKPIFVVALETGLRKRDLLGLKWSSVKFGAGVISVQTTKTGQDVVIPLSRACREALEECRNRPVVGQLVFVTEDGAPYPESNLLRYFTTAKRLAGITRRFRFHDLRHTFGSTLASAGVPLQIIAKALGHASTRMSERYARPSVESMKCVADALDSRNLNSFLNSTLRKGEG